MFEQFVARANDAYVHEISALAEPSGVRNSKHRPGQQRPLAPSDDDAAELAEPSRTQLRDHADLAGVELDNNDVDEKDEVFMLD